MFSPLKEWTNDLVVDHFGPYINFWDNSFPILAFHDDSPNLTPLVVPVKFPKNVKRDLNAETVYFLIWSLSKRESMDTGNFFRFCQYFFSNLCSI